MSNITAILCAWILWAHWVGAPNDGLNDWQKIDKAMTPFEIVQAYDTRAECETSRGTTRLQKGYDRSLCLPDTFNPNAKQK